MKKLSLDYDVATEGHYTQSTATDEEVKKLKEDLDNAKNEYKKAKKEYDEKYGKTGGAMRSMQHRINTSINDFLKSSKLIKW
jgi:DNA-directed RNA polymerase alpha subunit